LAPVALASSGPALVELAAALADSDTPKIYALHLVRPLERGGLGAQPPVPATAHEALEPLVAYAQAHGITVHPLTMISRAPGADICDVARVKGAKLIVMGWHKPTFSQALLGGTVQQVMRGSTADVAVFIDRGASLPPKRILVPYTGTVHDRAALALVARLVRRQGAHVTILHVVRPHRPEPRFKQDAERILAEEYPDPINGAISFRVVESLQPVEVVLREAGGYDLTVLGVGEEWQLTPHLFGLRSERLAVYCPSSLLIVRTRAQPTPQPVLGIWRWLQSRTAPAT
jgi:nucleotide-binding universal stress UspA family protein